jgi:two-component sensor histidine kinase
VVQNFASFLDLTRHARSRSEARCDRELNHRVKNTLATVQSIVSQALRKSSDMGSAQEAIESRLVALSQSHNLLTRESWNSTGLRDVVVNALEPFGMASGPGGALHRRGPNIPMPPKAVLALSIAFHELATHAVKYGAFSSDAGPRADRVDGGAGPKVAVWSSTGASQRAAVVPPTAPGLARR